MTKEKDTMALRSVESQNVEFKSNWPKARLERDEYLKVICTFVNTGSGKAVLKVLLYAEIQFQNKTF